MWSQGAKLIYRSSKVPGRLGGPIVMQRYLLVFAPKVALRRTKKVWRKSGNRTQTRHAGMHTPAIDRRLILGCS